MSWFHKSEDNDPYKGKLKYYEDLSYTLQTKVDQLEKENKELKKVSTDILLDRAPATGHLPNDPSFSTIVANISVVERNTRHDPASRLKDGFIDINYYTTTYVMRICLGKVIVGTIYYNRYIGSSIVWCKPSYLSYLSTSFETVEVLNQYKKYIKDNIDEVGKFVYDNTSQLMWRYTNHVGNSANNI